MFCHGRNEIMSYKTKSSFPLLWFSFVIESDIREWKFG